MTHRPLVMVALVLAMLLAAMEATIIATAMPSIAASLGGFSLYGWVFSAYLLMQAVTTPIFGKLADLYGRKPVFLAGVSIFLIGSGLCAVAPTMKWLVLWRLVQGTGAGAVTPIAVTLAGDLYTLEERGKVQGYLASVWGVSSILGPLAGAFLIESVGWPWIFWLNLPVGVVSMGLLAYALHEQRERHGKPLDLAGAALLLTGLTALMLSLTQSWPWLALLGVAALVGFVAVERRAADPIVHLELWADPIIWRGNLAVLMLGVAMIGLSGFLPTYIQGVLHRTPLVAGLALSTMCLGWPVCSVMAGKALLRMDVRVLVRLGGTAATVGALVVAVTSPWGAEWAALGSLLMGCGFGVINTSFVVSIQTGVPWEKRGMATALNMLMRNLGNALGAALLGALLNHRLGEYIRTNHLENQVSLDSVKDLVHAGAHPHPLLEAGLAQSLELVFWAIFASVALCALAGWTVPRTRLR